MGMLPENSIYRKRIPNLNYANFLDFGCVESKYFTTLMMYFNTEKAVALDFSQPKFIKLAL